MGNILTSDLPNTSSYTILTETYSIKWNSTSGFSGKKKYRCNLNAPNNTNTKIFNLSGETPK